MFLEILQPAYLELLAARHAAHRVELQAFVGGWSRRQRRAGRRQARARVLAAELAYQAARDEALTAYWASRKVFW